MPLALSHRQRFVAASVFHHRLDSQMEAISKRIDTAESLSSDVLQKLLFTKNALKPILGHLISVLFRRRSKMLNCCKHGEMAEWLKAHAWKACLGETLTWVRIPLSPPCFQPLTAIVICKRSTEEPCR